MIDEIYLKHNRNEDTVQVAYVCDIDTYEILHSFVDCIYNDDENYDAEDNDDDMVNHPLHYVKNGIECIHEMILLYGVEETKSFCKLNAHKYRKRAMDKGGREDMKKSDWYVKMYAYLDNNSEYTIKQAILKLYEELIKL